MIIGNGAIASALTDKEDKLFFASGISNSQETDESAYQAEKDLLAQIPRQFQKEYQIVYFSSLGIFTTNTRYFRHKKEMEELIKKWPRYAIVRIGNITWKNNNPHTIINSMRERYKKSEKLEIRDEYRYLVDKDEFLYWINIIPEWSCELSISGRRMKIKDMVKEFILT